MIGLKLNIQKKSRGSTAIQRTAKVDTCDMDAAPSSETITGAVGSRSDGTMTRLGSELNDEDDG